MMTTTRDAAEIEMVEIDELLEKCTPGEREERELVKRMQHELHEGNYGATTKMTVKVTTPEGATWLAWVTVPASVEISDAELRGKTVELTATLSPGSGAHFAFGKRPTGVRVIDAAGGAQ